MSFLNPLALIGLALVSLPVIVHLLARRLRGRLDFPTLRYLRETPSFRLRPRKLHEPLLLALRVLALILLILGIARPLMTWRAASQPTHLILLDGSLSMRAPGRADAAREEARSLINRLARGERAAIINCSSDAVLLSAATADHQQLLAAVEKYQPGNGAIDFNNGFAAATALLEREAPGAAEIDLISDFQKSNLAGLAGQLLQLPARVRPHAVGAPLERNAFLLDAAVWKNDDGLKLSASEIVEDAEGHTGERRAWTIDAQAGEQPGIIWRTEANGQLTGRMRSIVPDDFDLDDERYFAFTPPRPARVLLIETDAETSLYQGAALEAAASSLDNKRQLLTRQKLLPAHAAELNSYALVALNVHGALRADELQLLVEYAEAGGTVWLSLARDADTAALNRLASTDAGRALPFKSLTRLSGGALSFGPADLSAPSLRSLTASSFEALRAVSVHEGYAFEQRDGADTLMRWNNGTAAFVSTLRGGGRLLLLGVSTESAASELGRSPAFPSLAYSILREASAPRDPMSYNLGEAVDLNLAPDAGLRVTDDSGRVTRAQARDLMQRPLSFLSGPGVYSLESEKGVRFIALNTPGPESERALADSGEVQLYFDRQTQAPTTTGNEWREATERSGNLWRYFLGAAFLLLAGELFIRARLTEFSHRGTEAQRIRSRQGES